MKSKKVVATLLMMTMVFMLIPTISSPPTKAAAIINIGEYLQMGKYYDEPILWRCVDIDENGPLMLSDKILSIKPLDAAGNHKYLDGTNQADNSYHYRTENGSNLWETSNMRSWLNSTATAGNVIWLGGCPPTADKVMYGYNGYANEKGFLADGNFTENERNAMKSVVQKSLLNGIDSTKLKVGGTAILTYNSNISTVLQNYNTAYYDNVTDKMFILDIKQTNKVYQNSNILGVNYYIGKPTQKAVDNSVYKSSLVTAGSSWHNWVRTPYATTSEPSSGRYVNNEGYVYYCDVNTDIIGVRTAFNLDLASIAFESGNGSAGLPYILEDTTPEPTATPTPEPTATPTPEPTATPTPEPTATPTPEPTAAPTPAPSATPTPEPTATPTPEPTATPTSTPTPTPLLGDVTGDGKIMPGDALKLLQFVSGKITLTDAQKVAADVTKNGLVQPSDALKILQYCSGKIIGF